VPLPTIQDLVSRGVTQADYQLCEHNNYYCEIGVDHEASHENLNRYGVTERFWFYHGDAGFVDGARYICNDCYLELGSGARRPIKPEGPPIRRAMPP